MPSRLLLTEITLERALSLAPAEAIADLRNSDERCREDPSVPAPKCYESEYSDHPVLVTECYLGSDASDHSKYIRTGKLNSIGSLHVYDLETGARIDWRNFSYDPAGKGARFDGTVATAQELLELPRDYARTEPKKAADGTWTLRLVCLGSGDEGERRLRDDITLSGATKRDVLSTGSRVLAVASSKRISLRDAEEHLVAKLSARTGLCVIER